VLSGSGPADRNSPGILVIVTLEDLNQRLREFAAARDWEQFHTPKNLVMALSGEVGELISLFQWLTPDECAGWRDDPALEANVLDEIADVTLYLVRLADMLGLDLLAAANAKVDRNELRFPVPQNQGRINRQG
jgi:NTP pyrophosphatase (non-canonical NTP hydrolase)